VEEGSPEEDTDLLFGNNRGKVKANMTFVLLVQLVKSRWTKQAGNKSKQNGGLLTNGEEITSEIQAEL
jgi:hypothetical protein